MVNSINLTMTSKDKIATWKANRRKLVSPLVLRNVLLFLTIYGGVLDSWYTRLHSPGNISAERLWEGV